MRLLLSLLLASSLAGCALLATFVPPDARQIDTWLADDEYGHLLDALLHSRPGDAGHEYLLAKEQLIHRKADSFANDAAQKSHTLARQGQWQEALAVSNAALRLYPHSTLLQENREKIEQLQLQASAQLEARLRLIHAESLARALPVHEQRAATLPDSMQVQQELATLHQQARDLGMELISQGRMELARKNFQDARHKLSLALRLAPGPEARQANRELLQQQAPPRSTSGAVDDPDRRTRADELLPQYHAAWQSQNWHEAQRLLALLELEPEIPDELPQLRSELAEKIADIVSRLILQGNTLYTEEKYEQALATWRKAKILDPDNPHLEAQILRGQRVLEKLQALQEKSQERQPAQ